MIEMPLDPKRLVAHAEAFGFNRNPDEDLGYAIHGWLQAALGELAPSPFRVIESRQGPLRLLGYGPADAQALSAYARKAASPLAEAVCPWDRIASKRLDNIPWQPDQKLRFEVRVCPIIRGKQGERDAFLAQLPTDSRPTERGRYEVYRDWLGKRFGDAVELEPETVSLKAFRLVSTFRQGYGHRERKRRGRRLVRPDALMEGRLRIRDPDGFRSLMQRGIGRHRAFGFGMLLVRPG
jgi:CRISPR system Cascade subunit CasE